VAADLVMKDKPRHRVYTQQSGSVNKGAPTAEDEGATAVTNISEQFKR